MKHTLAILLLASGPALAAAQDYPTFRGAKRDGHSSDTGLLKEWPKEGPKLLWKNQELGAGYAGVASFGGKVYTLGDKDGSTNLLCIDAESGKLLWKSRVGKELKDKNDKKDWWQNRATPSTDGRIVVALAPLGELVAFSCADGKEVWRKHLVEEFGGQAGYWDYSESPLIDGDQVAVIAGGSKGAVLALKKDSGQPVWQSKEFTEKAEYASLVPVEIGGIKQYLAFTSLHVAGIAAADGKLLWKQERRPAGTKMVAVIPTPIYKDGVLFVCSGYGIGHDAYQISAEGGAFKLKELYKGGELENHHGGVILAGDHLYGINNSKALICMDLKTGKVAWQDKTVAKGSLVYADGLFISRAEDKKTGTVVMFEASPAGYKEKGRFNPPDLSGWPVWAHPTISGGKLYLRDQNTLHCYAVK